MAGVALCHSLNKMIWDDFIDGICMADRKVSPGGCHFYIYNGHGFLM